MQKEKWHRNLEIIHLLEEGTYILALKVEFLATGKHNSESSQDDNNKKAIEYFQTIVGIGSTNPELRKTLDLALKIVDEQEDKEKALENLNKIRDVYLKLLSDYDKFIVRLSNFPPR